MDMGPRIVISIPRSSIGILIDIFYSDPTDDVLRDALYQYAKEGLTTKERLERLKVEFGLEIKWLVTFQPI